MLHIRKQTSRSHPFASHNIRDRAHNAKRLAIEIVHEQWVVGDGRCFQLHAILALILDYTDDLAPVEWLTDLSILRYAAGTR